MSTYSQKNGGASHIDYARVVAGLELVERVRGIMCEAPGSSNSCVNEIASVLSNFLARHHGKAGRAPNREGVETNGMVPALELNVREVEDRLRVKGVSETLIETVLWQLPDSGGQTREHGLLGQAFNNARQDIIAATLEPDQDKCTAALSRANSFYNFLCHIERTASFPRIATRIYLVLSLDPAARDAVADLGELCKKFSLFVQFESFNESLQALAQTSLVMDRRTFCALLSHFAQSYGLIIEESKARGRSGPYPEPDWTLQDLAVMIAHFGVSSRTEYYQQIAAALGLSKNCNMILQRLSSQAHFKELGEYARASVFVCIAKTLQVASTSKSDLQRQLLTNCIEQIVSGRVQLDVKESKIGLKGWYPSQHQLRWRQREAIFISSSYYPFNLGSSSDNSVIGTLAHELSHAASKFDGRYQSLGAFEEEMRAWMVGFLASEGRLPNKREAAQQALDIIYIEDYYPEIQSTWRKDPSAFAAHFRDLGLYNVRRNTSTSELEQQLEDISPTEAAPLWGWDGFLVNNPAPPDFKSGERRNPFPTIGREAQRQKGLSALNMMSRVQDACAAARNLSGIDQTRVGDILIDFIFKCRPKVAQNLGEYRAVQRPTALFHASNPEWGGDVSIQNGKSTASCPRAFEASCAPGISQSRSIPRQLISRVREAVAWADQYAEEETARGRAFANAKEHLFFAASLADPDTCAEQLIQALAFFQLLQVMEGDYNWSEEARELYFRLSLRSEAFRALCDFGILFDSSECHSTATCIVETLHLLTVVASDIPNSEFYELLSYIAGECKSLINQPAFDIAKSNTRWGAGELSVWVAKFYSGSSANYYNEISAALDLTESESAMFVPLFADSAFLVSRDADFTRLKRLLNNSLFRGQVFSDQVHTFNILFTALNVAASSEVPLHQNLLTRTVDLILSGAIWVSFLYGNHGVRYRSSDRVRPARTVSLDCYKEISIGTLVHEVSYAVSPAPLDGSKAARFEDEMRAWLVVQVAETQRLPSLQEAATHAVRLVSESSPCQALAQDYQNDPQAIFGHLQALGFNLAQGLWDLTDLSSQIEDISDTQIAPLWGWDGFLINEPAPPDFVSGKMEKVPHSLDTPPEFRIIAELRSAMKRQPGIEGVFSQILTGERDELDAPSVVRHLITPTQTAAVNCKDITQNTPLYRFREILIACCHPDAPKRFSLERQYARSLCEIGCYTLAASLPPDERWKLYPIIYSAITDESKVSMKRSGRLRGNGATLALLVNIAQFALFPARKSDDAGHSAPLSPICLTDEVSWPSIPSYLPDNDSCAWRYAESILQQLDPRGHYSRGNLKRLNQILDYITGEGRMVVGRVSFKDFGHIHELHAAFPRLAILPELPSGGLKNDDPHRSLAIALIDVARILNHLYGV
jgi:hypothetical protein